jgi:hypothetical protein
MCLSASGHGRLQNKSTHVPSAAARRTKKTQAKKIQEQRKKTCDSHLVEENPTEEDPHFKPADLPYYRNGADILPYSRNSRLKVRRKIPANSCKLSACA